LILKGCSKEIKDGFGYGGMCLEAKSSSTIIPIVFSVIISKIKNIRITKLL
ncbi:unnamed protein product, partial [marine sediment metagenome]